MDERDIREQEEQVADLINHKIDRRKFMKQLGIGSAVTATALVGAAAMDNLGNTDNGKYVKGGYKQRDSMGTSSITRDLPKHFYKEIDPRPGWIGTTEILEVGEQMDGRMHAFARVAYCNSTGDFSEENSGKWGPLLKKANGLKAEYMATLDNETKLDYQWSGIFVQAMDRWHMSLEHGKFAVAPIASTPMGMSAEENTAVIKKLARWFGMEQCGICEVTEDLKPFFYHTARARGTAAGGHKDFYDPGVPVPWPYPYKYCIVLMDKCDDGLTNGYYGPLAEAAAKIACADSDFPPHYLETIIRQMGYDAKANIFCDSDIIEEPFAVAAGLGEIGRSGLFMSPWGASFRLCEVFTNMPLVPDKPMDFGLQNFCKVCKKCAENCPSGAISMDDEPSSMWTTVNARRWPQDTYKCMEYRVAYGCSTCQGICMWSKPDTLIHEIGRTLGQNKAFASVLVKMDDLFYGRKPEPNSCADYAPWR